MAQLLKGETFTDVSPGKTVTSTRLNNHVDGATVLVGAVTEQVELVTGTAANDFALVADVSDLTTANPKKVQLQNLMPEVIRQGTQQYAAGAQAGGVYAVTLSPAATGYNAGMVVRFKADSINTGAVQINVNALGARNLVGPSGQNLEAGDIQAGQVVTTIFDGANFQLQGVAPNSVGPTKLMEPARNQTSQYAPGAQAVTVYTVTLTPAATAYTAGMVVRFLADTPNAGAVSLSVNGLGNQSLVGRDGLALSPNEILAGQIVTAVYDGAKFQIERAIKTAFSAVAAGTLAGGQLQFAHGLGAVPSSVRCVLQCVTLQGPFAVGDELLAEDVFDSAGSSPRISVRADATNVSVIVYDTGIRVVSAASTLLNLTAANWKVKVYAKL